MPNCGHNSSRVYDLSAAIVQSSAASVFLLIPLNRVAPYVTVECDSEKKLDLVGDFSQQGGCERRYAVSCAG